VHSLLGANPQKKKTRSESDELAREGRGPLGIQRPSGPARRTILETASGPQKLHAPRSVGGGALVSCAPSCRPIAVNTCSKLSGHPLYVCAESRRRAKKKSRPDLFCKLLQFSPRADRSRPHRAVHDRGGRSARARARQSVNLRADLGKRRVPGRRVRGQGPSSSSRLPDNMSARAAALLRPTARAEPSRPPPTSSRRRRARAGVSVPREPNAYLPPVHNPANPEAPRRRPRPRNPRPLGTARARPPFVHGVGHGGTSRTGVGSGPCAPSIRRAHVAVEPEKAPVLRAASRGRARIDGHRRRLVPHISTARPSPHPRISEADRRRTSSSWRASRLLVRHLRGPRRSDRLDIGASSAPAYRRHDPVRTGERYFSSDAYVE